MRVIQNKWIPFKGYKYINLFGLIFTRDASKINAKEYNHEKIHLKQMQEMLWLPFYLWYRIDPSLGYIKGNLQLVCMAVNQMKNDLTIEQLKYFCRSILQNNK